MSLSTEEIDQIAEAVALKNMRYASPVLNTEEAMHYVGKDSDGAFRAWRKRWSVSMCADGRYSRRALDMGLNKESRQRHKRAFA
jgi:hypothetical protein